MADDEGSNQEGKGNNGNGDGDKVGGQQREFSEEYIVPACHDTDEMCN